MPDSPQNEPPTGGLSQPFTQPPPPPPFQPVAVPPPQPYQPVAAPPPKSGSSALKIILIIVGIFVGLGMIGAGIVGYGVYRVAKAVHKDANGQITINTAKGTLSANSADHLTESDLGIAIYPGAEQGKGGLRMKIGGKSMVTANYLTSDSEDHVIAFYKDKAGPEAQSVVSGGTAQFVLKASNGDSVRVMITQNAGMNNGKTMINIIRASKG